jgi:cell wall-associated NlpC family hydrolase
MFSVAPNLLEDMKRHAMEQFPEESCGVLTEDAYIPIPNVAEQPHVDFLMAAAPWHELYLSGVVRAVVHSHSSGTAHPSKSDMISQRDVALPFGIVVMNNKTSVREVFWFGDQARDMTRPYEGRVFRHGVDDCYELAREWYKRERNVSLPYFPRNANWWNTGDEVLRDNFADMGFKEIDFRQLKPGDALLMHIMSQKINHCGVYSGNDILLHHLWGSENRVRYSRRDNIHAWRSSISKCLRYAP